MCGCFLLYLYFFFCFFMTFPQSLWTIYDIIFNLTSYFILFCIVIILLQYHLNDIALAPLLLSISLYIIYLFLINSIFSLVFYLIITNSCSALFWFEVLFCHDTTYYYLFCNSSIHYIDILHFVSFIFLFNIWICVNFKFFFFNEWKFLKSIDYVLCNNIFFIGF